MFRSKIADIQDRKEDRYKRNQHGFSARKDLRRSARIGRARAGADNPESPKLGAESPDREDVNAPGKEAQGEAQPENPPQEQAEPEKPKSDDATPKPSAEGTENAPKPPAPGSAEKAEKKSAESPDKEPEEMKEKWDSKSRKEGTKKEEEETPPVDKDFYKFYLEKGNRARAAENATRPSLRQFVETFKGCWAQLVSVFLVFFVTLAVFPAVLAGTTPHGKGEPWNSAIPKELYPGITVFLNFNLLAAIGSTTANFVQFPGPRFLLYPVLARLFFIPYFMLCNYNVDDRIMPVLFKNEWFFIIGNAVMAYTSGYFSSLAMMYAPR
ncbi:nucleoside transporter [Necator americanus]|uniref:Nucleoside transporter n=1 Tax=Necator americanus TaxID=51031 RepID=W2TGC2_NECAM|nr:nucleoside transporter [Necator americanus]ETN80067.1 nucleoside transporter [Necator americanus]